MKTKMRREEKPRRPTSQENYRLLKVNYKKPGPLLKNLLINDLRLQILQLLKLTERLLTILFVWLTQWTISLVISVSSWVKFFLFFAPIEAEQVITTIRKFKTSQGHGLDGISSFFLKSGMPVLAEPLAELFYLSRKIARIAPFHNTDATVDRLNYRPIPVLPIVSQLFEKLVKDHL